MRGGLTDTMVTNSELQPPFRAGQPSGFDSIRGSELADRLGQIVANRTFRQVQFIGNFAAGVPFSRAPQDLAFPLGKRIRSAVPRFESQLRIHHPESGLD